ncbi:HalOD1 output domain-containing protein [Natrarchaeobius chitinivorans]|uniref:HalOD1 output domain-containing protein n=1 Tax=Natrarchaeobius chitinivorans TaxID=1679083 RepID=UPI000F53B8EC|nr:HalOD1 output domain-containing protein [Natrarchaeobius chitinivorans]
MSGAEMGDEAVVDTMQDGETISRTILRLVSVLKDRKPSELEQPLYNAIDPEALNSLFQEQSMGKLTFKYHGCTVTVWSSGKVSVEPSQSIE